MLRVVDHQFLPKGVNVHLCPAGNYHAVRVYGSKPHEVFRHISPKASDCGDYNGVVYAGLHSIERNHVGLVPIERGIKMAERDELVEDSVAYGQQHSLSSFKRILKRKISLGRIVVFQIVHVV